jgi:ArsR family transcriptional regulator, arsenate/arsenite/antimonite-responsive transcriptional repressor
MRQFLTITKALADETRLRILMALRDGELCICQITALLKMAPSTVSRHLSLLSQAGLIDKRKCGKWAYCRLAGPDAPETVRSTLALVTRALASCDRISRDVTRLAEVKAMSLEELCQPLKPAFARKVRIKG